jgi:hypothetical protein
MTTANPDLRAFRTLGSLAVMLTALAAFAPSARAQTFSDPLTSTNAYAPFEVGAIKVLRGKSDGERIHVVDDYQATTRTFTFSGQMVECHLLREVEFKDGVLEEISYNYFAEDDDGDVYYFGETVDIYEDGVIVAHDGSWLVGGPTDPGDPIDTANAPAPTLFMPADPQAGDTWKPEDLFPIVDETVEAQNVTAKVKVPYGKFQDALQVEETSQIPDSDPEKKWYVGGIGVVKAKAKGEKLALEASSLEEADGDA